MKQDSRVGKQETVMRSITSEAALRYRHCFLLQCWCIVFVEQMGALLLPPRCTDSVSPPAPPDVIRRRLHLAKRRRRRSRRQEVVLLPSSSSSDELP